ncbi:MAG: peptidoglycan DD-metalloendopeptidase family protein [Gammaproteobacteria bacterium]|jgi:lipoprotein NlpD|nr:peptidoglycan DD-metalloendopeptidase family protein [Gammaproteobacteria bacterium]MBU1846341.1 peptidoglycan DD-metalloendopeptidase family protein [Gammaproteobacteria bacterium]
MKKTLSILSGVCVLLASCAGNRPAPIEERAPATAAQALPAPAAPVARAGHHIVQKGETLYSIALEHGQDWRDLVTWNNLDNANLIRIGQELRVAPVEGAVQTQPIAPSAVESRPLETAAPATPPAETATASSAMLKREPLGGIEPYSDDMLARMKAGGGAAKPATAAQAPAAAAVPAATAAAPAAPAAVRTEEGVEWSWPAGGRVIARFGDGSSKGVDVAGRLGEPVLAAAGGRVVYAGEAMRGYGKLVIVKHDNTFLSAYAHNSKILVQERDTVKRGQRIAELGDSDTEAGKPRLHFEIRRQGKPVDPLKYLPPR